MQINQPLTVFSAVAGLLMLAACGKEPATPASEPLAKPADTAAATALPRTASPPGARVFFITPADGETVSSPFTVEFGIEGMSVVKSGDNTPQSGHHHLLVDTNLPALDTPIPADQNHIHFGDGSTATELTLPPGEHTLSLLLGDHLHIPHDPPVMSAAITVTVQ